MRRARHIVSMLPVGGGPSETCLGTVSGATATDAATPASGDGFWYLVRGKDACGVGGYGTTSAGAPRTSLACP